MDGPRGNNGDSSSLSEGGGESSAAGSGDERWTCEACGCNTNRESDRSCTICGTSRSDGAVILRRAGYAARASGLFARSAMAARRNILNGGNEDQLPFGSIMMDGYYHDFFESVIDGDVDIGASAADDDDDDHAVAAMAMEASGLSNRSGSAGARLRAAAAIRGVGPRSVFDAARSLSMSPRETVHRLTPEELLHAAEENNSLYQPKWMNPSQIGGRMRTGNGIEVGEGANQSVAYLPLGSGEGRALRALEAFPRSFPFASFSMSSTSASSESFSGTSDERKPRRVFGFKVAFAHPSKETGEDMGGRYLVGVTTTSFSSFSEKNALQQSPFFYGIDDGGSKYEGTRNHSTSLSSREGVRSRRRSSFANELNEDEAPRNSAGALFGSKEVITCVVDLEGRTLTFWRDEDGESKLLGTLVTNIPRSVQLYPVVVPYSAGSIVSITGMSGEPLPLLSSFATSWKQAQEEKDALQRKRLREERSVLVQNGAFTAGLVTVLQEIFSRYERAVAGELTHIEASRLWYKCSLKLSSLKEILDDSRCSNDTKVIRFKDFCQLLQRILTDDEVHYPIDLPIDDSENSDFKIGDKVELVNNYERFGDATNGPLLPGDRGTVIELQGAQGLRHSIRVIYNSRRWWYQPQALVRERSGLTDSPGIWFLKAVLRSHGYNETTLDSLVGKPVSTSSWKIGDLVAPKKLKSTNHSEHTDSHGIDEAVGRIVHESSASGPFSVRARAAGSVNVVFVSRAFAESTYLQTGSSFKEKSVALESRKVPISRLVHTSAFHGVSASQKVRKGTRLQTRGVEQEDEEMDSDGTTYRFTPEFKRIKELNVSAIEAIMKECDRTSTSLVGLVEAGLSRSILQALDQVMKNVQVSDKDESIALSISALGKLAFRIVENAFPSECCASTANKSALDQKRPVAENSNSLEAKADENSSPAENADSSTEDENGRVSRSSSLMQRRRMLLSLMSRARRSGSDSLGDMISREMNLLPSLEMGSDAEAFFFAPPSAGDNFDDDSSRQDESQLENSRPRECSAPEEIKASPKNLAEDTLLDDVYRGRDHTKITNKGAGREKCKIPFESIKNVVSIGILENSLPWLKAFLGSFAQKINRKQSATEFPILNHALDDDGMPLLQLAISFGCSNAIIEELIRYGAPVTESELQLAVDIDLPETLSVLLQHHIYSDGIIDLKKCSSVIARVVQCAKERQESERQNLRREISSFLVSFTQKLFQIGLKRRRQQQLHEDDILGRTVSRILVGNTEICALQKGKKRVQVKDEHTSDRKNSVRSEVNFGINSCGILQVLPLSILGRCLSEEPSYFTNLLLFIEDYLCSKGVNDACVGLTLLLLLLKKFPLLSQSIEMERYGFAELVDSHAALSLNRLTEISSRIYKTHQRGDPHDGDAIFCPKKHAATLHITKHSSFRCDLCGSGVKCGALMHGCRECDWDACEACTDKVEGGILKWKFVRDLSSKCQDLFGQKTNQWAHASEAEEMKWVVRIEEYLQQLDNTSNVNNLSIRLLQRDPDAIQVLVGMLREKGCVTMHQFLMVILPALHSTLMGKSLSNEQHNSGRRTKKPRVAGIGSRESEICADAKEEERIEFAKEILKSLNDSIDCRDHNASNDLVEDEDGDFVLNDSGSEDERPKKAKAKNCEENNSKQLPELLRRLHRVLALHEDVSTSDASHSKNKNGVSSNNLRSLKELLKLRLRKNDLIGTTKQTGVKASQHVTIFSEPLVSVNDLSQQILKTTSRTHPDYVVFCRMLVNDSAIILERPSSQTGKLWRVAKIISYDARTGYHGIRYASGFTGRSSNKDESLDLQYGDDFSFIQYEAKTTNLILVARKFLVIHRDRNSDKKSAFDMEQLLAEGMVEENDESIPNNLSNMIGTIVESDFESSTWDTYTVVGVDCTENDVKYDILSADGQVLSGVPGSHISASDPSLTEGSDSRVSEQRSSRLSSDTRHTSERQGGFSRIYPFLISRTRQAEEEDEANTASLQRKKEKKSLKRSWSALALTESMCPVEVSPASEFDRRISLNPDKTKKFSCSIGGCNIELNVDRKLLESPPSLEICFHPSRSPSARIISDEKKTLVSLLQQLNQGKIDYFHDEGHEVLYSVLLRPSKEHVDGSTLKEGKIGFYSKPSGDVRGISSNSKLKADDESIHKKMRSLDHLSQMSTRKANLLDFDEVGSRCPGLDEICIQCIEIIEFLARINTRFIINKKENNSVFVNEDLSLKLLKQTENPLFTVGGVIPEWCLSLPALTPNIFSYTSRKALLDGIAFGISRSTLRQQDTKVNIGRLRQRMTALRARAVELVGEAFSGGSEDPTALQLQADELYGMEEALATRVRSAFKSEGWEEMALQVAKAAIHRESLLLDAMSIMDQYCGDSNLNRRRLEVRFDGESGFDAASGDEAGVTRGFYADIAEALMSCENVAGVNSSTICDLGLKSDLTKMSSKAVQGILKLPLWIPDVDATGQVVIPTPRAATSSIFGIFPRPLSKYHPQYSDVLKYFRFMGQLFASAMRDGFMFPLPLSSSFLKLVQYSGGSSLPHFDPAHGGGGRGDDKYVGNVLSSEDLPRPGFLGGEVYAAEQHICRMLDRIDHENQYPGDREREYRAVATHKNFARVALGKNYDCSFSEFFEDRVFVDPLDPTQGITAHPFCSNGCDRSVTIFNIREWVVKAKHFMLYEGVIGQAAAFKSGIDNFFSSDYLGLFTSEELQRDVCGMGDDVDTWDEDAIKKLLKLDNKGTTDALVAVAAIGGNAEALGRRFDPSSLTIKYVVRALLEASPKQRRQFLSFVTSVPIVTPGLIEIIPIVSSSGKFLPMRDPGCLPRANTCARRLYLPKFESYESFSEVLWAVVKAESKHKGFFEWNL